MKIKKIEADKQIIIDVRKKLLSLGLKRIKNSPSEPPFSKEIWEGGIYLYKDPPDLLVFEALFYRINIPEELQQAYIHLEKVFK